MAVHEKVRLKMEQIARYKLSGLKEPEIAQAVRLSTQGVYRICQDPEYQEVLASVRQSLLSKMDETLVSQKCDPLMDQMEAAVPLALQALLDGVKATRGAEPDLKTRMDAAKQILDRDPRRRFAQTSRSAPADGASGSPTAGLPANIMQSLADDHAAQISAIKDRDASLRQQAATHQTGIDASSTGVTAPDLFAMQPVAPGVN